MDKRVVTSVDMLVMPWEVESCHVGDDCWCRLIVPKEECFFDEATEAWVIPSGSLDTDTAEHIVELHNNHLEEQA